MKRKRSVSMNAGFGAGLISCQWKEELDGIIDLGMAKDAMALCKRVLLADRICNAADLEAVVIGIGVMANEMKSWQPLLESAYFKLPRWERSAGRSAMLAFYFAFQEHEGASRYLPKRNASARECYFGMVTHCALGHRKRAEAFAKRAGRLLESVDNELDASFCIHAIGGFADSREDWEASARIWAASPEGGILPEVAALRSVTANLHLANRAVLLGLEKLDRAAALGISTGMTLTVGRNEEERFGRAAEKLRNTRQTLEAAIGAIEKPE